MITAGFVGNGYDALYNLTDLELTPEGIYFSSTGAVGLLNYNGELLSHHWLAVNTGNTISFPFGTQISQGGDNAVLTPELEVLSDGQVVVVCTFNSYLNLPGLPESFTVNNGNVSTVVMNYNHMTGFSNPKRIATGKYLQGDLTGKTFVQKDANDNLTMLFHINETDEYLTDAIEPLELMDSVYYEWSATYMLSIDKDFNEVWQRHLTGFHIGDMEYSLATNDFYVTGYAHGSVAEVSGGNVEVLAENNGIQDNVGGLILAKFDENGNLASGRMWYTGYVPTTPNPNFLIQSRLSTTPCGDVSWYVPLSGTLSSYGEEIEFTMPSVVGFKNDCINDNCVYVSTTDIDTLYICNGADLEVNIPISIYGNDPLVYHLVENSVSLPSQSSASSLIPVTSQSTQVVVESPVSASYFISMVDIDYAIDHDSTWCNTSGYLQAVGTPSSFNYNWQPSNSIVLNDTLSIYISEFAQPSSVYVPVTIFHPNYCSVLDSIHYTVNLTADPNIESFYIVGCNESLSIPYNSTYFNGPSTWVLNGNQTSNNFADFNLFNGTNNLNLTLTTADGCSWNESVLIFFCQGTGGLTDSEIDESMIMGPNPSNGDVFIETSSPMKSIKVVTLEGKEVFKIIVNQENHLDFKLEVENGMYWIFIETDERQYKRSIIIQK